MDKKGHKKRLLKNQDGFTLVEIIAVLIILGILAAVAVPRYIDLEENARIRAIEAGVSELNGRENLTWANTKISVGGYSLDATLFGLLNTDLGTDYRWVTGPGVGGGELAFQITGTLTAGDGVVLTRLPSDSNTPGNWTSP